MAQTDKTKPKSARVEVNFSSEVHRWLSLESKRRGVSMASIVREALAERRHDSEAASKASAEAKKFLAKTGDIRKG